MAGNKLFCAGCMQIISDGEPYQVCSTCKRAFHSHHACCPLHQSARMESRIGGVAHVINQLLLPQPVAGKQTTIYIPPLVVSNTIRSQAVSRSKAIRPSFWDFILWLVLCTFLGYFKLNLTNSSFSVWVNSLDIAAMILVSFIYGPVFVIINSICMRFLLGGVIYQFGIDLSTYIGFGLMFLITGINGLRIPVFRSLKGILMGYLDAALGMVAYSLLIGLINTSSFLQALNFIVSFFNHKGLSILISLPIMMLIAGKWRDR